VRSTSERALAARAPRCLLVTGAALALMLGLIPTAHGQLRYVIHGDFRERYDSNVFAGTPGDAQWDLITELEPGFRMYYGTDASLLSLQYQLLFQLFARTADPNAEHKLLGYGNNFGADYTRLIGPRTGWRIADRFAQGTENVTVPGLGAGGQTQAQPYLTAGSKFITNSGRLELQHLFSEQWSIRPAATVDYYHVYDRAPNTIPAPNTVSAILSNRVDYLLESNSFSLEAELTTLREQGIFVDASNHILPNTVPLLTFVISHGLGWYHVFNEFWNCNLLAGVELRVRENAHADPAEHTEFDLNWGPLAGAALRYHRGQSLRVDLGYSHRFASMIELEAASISNLDEVTLDGHYILDDWFFEAGGSFRYIRATTAQIGMPNDQTATKVARARAVIGYLIRRGLSLELTYELELVRDHLTVGEVAAQPSTPDYTRHQVALGLSLAWPPPPRQDVRLNRRESEYEPIFSLGGSHDASRSATPAAGLFVDPRARRTRQEEQRERAEEHRRHAPADSPQRDPQERVDFDTEDTEQPPL